MLKTISNVHQEHDVSIPSRAVCFMASYCVDEVCGCIPGEWFSSRSAIAILVTQDFLAIFVVSQAWLISLALVLRLCDSDGVLVDWWPGPDHKHEGFMYAIQHHKVPYVMKCIDQVCEAPYYLCACFITFIVVGILYLWIEPSNLI